MTAALRWRLIAWYCGAVGSVTLYPWVATLLVSAGLDRGTAATALVMLPIATLLGGPLWSWTADRTDGGGVLRATTTVGAIAAVLLTLAPGPTWMLVALVLLALGRSGMFPVADALTLSLLGADRRAYGRIRAAGSAAFAVAMVLGGALAGTWPRAPLWIGATLLSLAAGMAWTLPSPPRLGERPKLADVLQVARDPVLRLLVVGAFFHGVTLTTYDHLYPLHVSQLGLPSWVTGVSVAAGVTVEVGVLWYGRQLLTRIGPLPMLGLALASGLPRWWITGTLPDPRWLVVAQAMHGVGFGMYWVAGVATFNERAPPNLAASAQALFTVTTFGVGWLASMSVAGVVLRYAETSTLFLGMCAVSAAALFPWSAAWSVAARYAPRPAG